MLPRQSHNVVIVHYIKYTDVVSERQKHVPSPEMKDLMDAFYHTVADKWEHIGIYLHLPLATLKAISEEHQRDPCKCLVEMLGVWLKRVHPPPTLVCHHWCCGVSWRGTAWEKTQRKVSTLNNITTCVYKACA